MNLKDAEIVVAETALRENFSPLSLTRSTFDFLHGTKTFLQRIEEGLGRRVSQLVVPRYLADITKEDHPYAKVNQDISTDALVVASTISASFELGREIEKAQNQYDSNFVILDASGDFVFALLDEFHPEEESFNIPNPFPKRRKVALADDRNRPLLKYPWDLITQNSEAINSDFKKFHGSEKERDIIDAETLAKGPYVHETAEIGRFVSFDSRNGPILVDDGAEIQSFSHVSGPSYIGKKSILKSVKLREGCSVGRTCKISGEIESSIIFDYTNKNHDGFLGHSILGSWVNLGAGTTNSDLKNTYGDVKMRMKGKITPTGTNKMGVVIGDMAKTAIGTMIFSGKKIGVCSNVFGFVRTDVPSFTLFNGEEIQSSREMYFESAVETQRKMMSRRSVELTKSFERLMKTVFDLTNVERSETGVKAGKFSLD